MGNKENSKIDFSKDKESAIKYGEGAWKQKYNANKKINRNTVVNYKIENQKMPPLHSNVAGITSLLQWQSLANTFSTRIAARGGETI